MDHTISYYLARTDTISLVTRHVRGSQSRIYDPKTTRLNAVMESITAVS